MEKYLELKSEKGNCTIFLSQEYMQFALTNDEAHGLLKEALAKLNAFEEKYLVKHPEVI